MKDEKNINESVDFERKEVNYRVLAWLGAGIIVSALLMHLFLYLFYTGIKNAEATKNDLPATLVEAEKPPSNFPQLQAHPTEDMRQLRESENERLNGYGWIDREKGVVRIPIDEAMRKLARRGLPQINQANQANQSANQSAPILNLNSNNAKQK